MEPARIRPAHAGDADALARLMGHLGYPATAQQMRARLERILPSPDHRALVAETDGAGVVGMAGVFRGWSYNHDAPYGRVIALVVDPACRGGGIGAALLAAAEAWAREAGAGAVHLTTARHRDGAHRFYERLGYAATGVRYFKALG